MTTSILQFVASAVVIIVAGAVLTQCGDRIAERTRLGRMLVGTILIAGTTSLPELGVNTHAVLLGASDMALGDLIGSSLINLLILSVLDLTHYSERRMLSPASRHQTLSAGVSISLMALVGAFITLGPQFGDFEIGRIGPGPWIVLAAYLLGLRLIQKGQRERKAAADAPAAELWPPVLNKLSLRGAIVGFVLAGALILTAAPFLARAAQDLAEQTGFGGTFFGSTFVAVCTSLPEIVTTFTAVRLQAFDLALGNILGSNCFNMVLIAPLDLAHPGSLLSAVESTHVYLALCGIVVTSVVVLGQLYHVERRRPLLEPDAWLALVLILASLTGLYFIK